MLTAQEELFIGTCGTGGHRELFIRIHGIESMIGIGDTKSGPKEQNYFSIRSITLSAVVRSVRVPHLRCLQQHMGRQT